MLVLMHVQAYNISLNMQSRQCATHPHEQRYAEL